LGGSILFNSWDRKGEANVISFRESGGKRKGRKKAMKQRRRDYQLK